MKADKSNINKKSSIYKVKANSPRFSIKDVSTSSRVVTGFFNTYNFFDSDNDILLLGCASKSIMERGVNSTATAKIKHALNHDLTQLVGKLQVLEEKTIDGVTGIYFESKLSNSTLGNDTLIKYLEGIYDNHSIGFQYINLERITPEQQAEWNRVKSMIINPEDMDAEECAYLVKEINLFEGSTVAFGANSLTPFLGTKSKNPETIKTQLIDRLHKLENHVKNGRTSDEMICDLSLQVKQLQQMINDLELPSAKVTDENQPTTQKQYIPLINYDFLNTNF